jgi:hypothetical protein
MTYIYIWRLFLNQREKHRHSSSPCYSFPENYRSYRLQKQIPEDLKQQAFNKFWIKSS